MSLAITTIGFEGYYNFTSLPIYINYKLRKVQIASPLKNMLPANRHIKRFSGNKEILLRKAAITITIWCRCLLVWSTYSHIYSII